MRGRKVVVPSNLTGKYAFAAIAVLLGSYVIRFDFGIILTTWCVIVLMVASMVLYTRVFAAVRSGSPPPVFTDRPIYRILRLAALGLFSLVYLFRLYQFVF